MNKTLFVVSLMGIVFLFSCQQKPVASNPPVPVNLYTITSQFVTYYDKYPSTTQALSQVNILPQVQGYITGIYFTDGSQVKKGQVLYEIDRRLYQAAVDAAEANLKVAQGNLAQDQQDADRYTYLNSYHAVAKQQYDHAIIALQNSKSQVRVAEENLKSAKTNLSYSVITAPFSGTIGFSQVKLGNMVTVGQTVLNTISTNNPMAVDFLVNEKQLTEFEKIKANNNKGIDSLFTLLLPDNSLYPYPGKISVVDRAVDPQTGSIRIRLIFPNSNNILKVGMSCIVQVRNLETTPQIIIPSKAIVEQMGEYFVYIAKDTIINHSSDSTKKSGIQKEETSKLHAMQRKVHLGTTIGANVIVTDGLQDGDRIIADGLQAIHDGSAIAIGNRASSNANKNAGQSQAGKHKIN